MKAFQILLSTSLSLLLSGISTESIAVNAPDIMCGGKCEGGLSGTNISGPGASTACEMYLDRDFQGGLYPVHPGAQIRSLGNVWNDKVSSVIVSNSCYLTVYLDDYFQGPQATYGPGIYPYVGDYWNDQISSVMCFCN